MSLTTTPKVFPLYVQTDASGNGRVQFNCTKSGVMFNVVKISVEMAPTSSGVVTLERNGGIFLSSLPVAPRMEAVGSERLHYSEYLTIAVIGGPTNTQIAVWVAYHEEEPADAGSAGLQWVQQTGPAGPVDNPVEIWSASGTGAGPGLISSGYLDVRAYSSILTSFSFTGGTYNTTDPLQIDFLYSPLPTGANGNFSSSYQVFKSNIVGGSNFRMTDIAHGAFLQAQFFDPNSTGRTFDYNVKMYGSFRPTPNVFLASTADSVLASINNFKAPGGPTAIQPINFGYGRAMWRLKAGAGGGATAELRYANSAILYDTLTAAAATDAYREIVLPRRQAYLYLTNASAANEFITTQVILQREPY